MRWGMQIFAAVAVLAANAASAPAIDWPEWYGEKRDGVWRETGLLEKFPPDGPKVLWRTPLGPGYSGPAVAKGRVYLMDRRPAKLADGKLDENVHGASTGTERLLCIDESNGHKIWIHEYNCPYTLSYGAGPRTTPLVRDGRVYALGAMGDLFCMDAAKGTMIWSRNLRKDFNVKAPVWGWAGHPLLDGDTLYCQVGGDGSAVVAFDKNTGRTIWQALSTREICYSPLIIIEAGGARQLIFWHSDAINSLDPATGKLYWSVDYPPEGHPQRPAASIVMPRKMGDYLFIASYYHGPMMLKLASDRPAAEVLWKDQTKSLAHPIGLHCLMATPWLVDGHVYGVCANGELRCCVAATGEQLWETYAATGGKKTDCGTAFIVPQGDRYIIFNDHGELILAKMSPAGYTEINRAKIIDAAEAARNRMVVWSHPAFADRKIFVRNSKELICVSMAQDLPG